MGDDYDDGSVYDGCSCMHPNARPPCGWCTSEDRVEEDFDQPAPPPDPDLALPGWGMF
jgi:hypothetical protein